MSFVSAALPSVSGTRGKKAFGAVPVIASIVITMFLAYLTLRSAHLVKRVLKQTGIAILERIFGLILAAIAVQFVFEGGRERHLGPGSQAQTKWGRIGLGHPAHVIRLRRDAKSLLRRRGPSYSPIGGFPPGPWPRVSGPRRNEC